jgi:hypothetical protein
MSPTSISPIIMMKNAAPNTAHVMKISSIADGASNPNASANQSSRPILDPILRLSLYLMTLFPSLVLSFSCFNWYFSNIATVETDSPAKMADNKMCKPAL